MVQFDLLWPVQLDVLHVLWKETSNMPSYDTRENVGMCIFSQLHPLFSKKIIWICMLGRTPKMTGETPLYRTGLYGQKCCTSWNQDRPQFSSFPFFCPDLASPQGLELRFPRQQLWRSTMELRRSLSKKTTLVYIPTRCFLQKKHPKSFAPVRFCTNHSYPQLLFYGSFVI